MTSRTNYDLFAQAYARENESSLLNAYYERPAMLELAGTVQGLQILDVGCGAGPLAEALVQRGALVSGFDVSQLMIDLARKRLGEGCDLRVADLSQPLAYADSSFDMVTASLVFHYLEEWVAPLQEIRRVLRPGGRLIMSVNHPLLFPWNHPGQDYFRLTYYTDDLEFDGQPAQLSYWHRPLQDMTSAFSQAGFQLQRISEPPYSTSTPDELIPEQLKDRDSFISFIFFGLQAT